MNAVTRMRAELDARKHAQLRLIDAHQRAEQATQMARTALRLTVQMAASSVNDELDHVSNAQAVARACICKGDLDATCVGIEQLLDDLVFQPLRLLAREAGDQ